MIQRQQFIKRKKWQQSEYAVRQVSLEGDATEEKGNPKHITKKSKNSNLRLRRLIR